MWRSWKAKGQEHAAHPHMEWGRQMAFINHFYFLPLGPGMGRGVLENQCVCALSDLDMVERS